MPELPEVETSRRGIAPYILGKAFKEVIVRQTQLRWPVPAGLHGILQDSRLDSIARRGKYLVLGTAHGSLILHLGMSGNLRIVSLDDELRKHDHVDFIFDDDTVLRFNDARKFGAVLWTTHPVEQHPLLCNLGPEPLSDDFDGAYLLQRAGKRSLAIKSLIMDSSVVVGVGNIYASESLFLAGLQPTRSAGAINLQDYQRLTEAIKNVLQRAIDQGGSTLRDFINPQGKPGYFQQTLNVYGRGGQPCRICAEPIQHLKIGQRASYYCNVCQR